MKVILIFLSMTCIFGIAEAQRCNIKTTCDQYGYSSDFLFDPCSGKIKSFPDLPEHEITRQKLATLDLQKKQILLTDGSLWNIPEAFYYNAIEWKAGDIVQIFHPQTYDGDTFNLINNTRGNQGVLVTSAIDEKYLKHKCYFRRVVESLTESKIYLNDQTAWEYDPDWSFQPIIAAVPSNAPVLYGVNTGPDGLERPILLISFCQLTPDRIAVKPTDP